MTIIRPAAEADGVRMARYAKAINGEAERLGVGRVMMLPEIVILARAVMAVADAEHERLRGVLDMYTAANTEALKVIAGLYLEAEDTRAALGFLEVEVAEQIAKVTERDATIERMQGLLAQEARVNLGLLDDIDTDAATIERVNTLCDSWANVTAAARVRAAIAGKP